VFERSFIIKAHNISYYLELFAKYLKNAVYLHMYRDPIQVINSVIKARIKRWGDINYWFGWKPKEFDLIKDMDIYRQVAGQVFFNEKAILDRKDQLGDRYINFSYEKFCNDPEKVYNDIINVINKYTDKKINVPYKGPKNFTISDSITLQERKKIEKAFEYFCKKYGELKYE
jgi:hypothetical protein